MKKYPLGIREEVVSRIRAGESQCGAESGSMKSVGGPFSAG